MPGDELAAKPYAHPRCYANCRGDCSSDLSSEHFLSRTLLARIEAPTGGVYVNGFPWQKCESQRIGINSLGSNILCRHHNSQLSPLDEEALHLVELLEKAAETDGIYIDTVRGDRIERYLLKVLCGMLASESACVTGQKIEWPIPKEWIDLLWGEQPFAYGRGLKINAARGEKWSEDPNSYHVAPIVGDGVPVGLRAVFRRLHLFLLMTDAVPELTAVLGSGPTFPIRQFVSNSRRGRLTINFRWW